MTKSVGRLLRVYNSVNESVIQENQDIQNIDTMKDLIIDTDTKVLIESDDAYTQSEYVSQIYSSLRTKKDLTVEESTASGEVEIKSPEEMTNSQSSLNFIEILVEIDDLTPPAAVAEGTVFTDDDYPLLLTTVNLIPSLKMPPTADNDNSGVDGVVKQIIKRPVDRQSANRHLKLFELIRVIPPSSPTAVDITPLPVAPPVEATVHASKSGKKGGSRPNTSSKDKDKHKDKDKEKDKDTEIIVLPAAPPVDEDYFRWILQPNESATVKVSSIIVKLVNSLID